MFPSINHLSTINLCIIFFIEMLFLDLLLTIDLTLSLLQLILLNFISSLKKQEKYHKRPLLQF